MSNEHRAAAEEWLESAESAVNQRDYDDPYPHEFIQSAALMAIAHALLAEDPRVLDARD